jgi:hypothetical protein
LRTGDVVGYSQCMSSTRDGVIWYPKGTHGNRDLQEWVAERDWVLLEGNERDQDGPVPVMLTMSRADSGRLICTGLIIGRQPVWNDGRTEVTSRSLRGIPIAEYIGLAQQTAEIPDSYGEAVRALLTLAPESPRARRRPGPKGYDDGHFEYVAAAYRRAGVEAPRAPMKWLTNYLYASEPTVRRWVQRARDRGYLGAAIPGRFGEAPIEEKS